MWSHFKRAYHLGCLGIKILILKFENSFENFSTKAVFKLSLFILIKRFLCSSINSCLICAFAEVDDNKITERTMLAIKQPSCIKSIDLIQDGCLIASIVLSVILLSSTSAKAQIKHELILEQRNLLIKMNKDNLKTALVEKFSKEFSNFNIRIFIPKHPRWYALLKWLHIKNYKVFLS